MDNMLITLDGKGRKQRIVPFSFMLRKALHRFVTEFNRKPDSLLFATRGEMPVDRMIALRGVKYCAIGLGLNLRRGPCTHSGIRSPSTISGVEGPCFICRRSWDIPVWK
jgi:site-specific recombinase XerD